jgi:hypothetical protein
MEKDMNNTMIARLLAKENISVQHGNYRTAFFDVEKRVLGLPQWKDMGKDVYDLLVGHEVGHALFTPADGWHDSAKEIPGCPRAYINIVEDIRIENLIQRQYPGLVGSFKRGYGVLDNEDFFGIADKDVNEMHIADRINLKSKLRDLIDVEFKDEESGIIKQVFAVETWEDVLSACRALYEFVEASKEDEPEDKNDTESFGLEMSDDPGQSDGTSDSEEGTSDESDNMDNTSSSKSSGEEGDAESESPESSTVESSEDTDKSEQTEAYVAGEGGHECETDAAFRQRESDLLDVDDYGRMKEVVKAITREQTNYMLVPYKEVFDIRDETEAEWVKLDLKTEVSEETLSSYATFLEESKKFVNLMAKEFEMRKMAYRYNRSQTSRSGSLNMNKLHAYKVTDDIFNSVTQLADAKSHGLVMFVDWSGSMGGVANDVMKQTLILAQFCKKVSIPFEVYSFTSGNRRPNMDVQVGQIDHERTKIVQLLSSRMSKADYIRGMRDIFIMSASVHRKLAWTDDMGGTPLNETVMASRFIIRDFKEANNIQKTNVVFMTDGDAQNFYVRSDWENTNPTNGMRIDMDGKMIDAPRNGRNVTPALFKALSKECNLIGYFISDSMQAFRSKVYQANKGYIPNEKMNTMRKQYSKNKFVEMDSVLGYDKFFILKADKGALNTDQEDLEIAADATRSQIRSAFKKHANSKKANKILATQFAKMVA